MVNNHILISKFKPLLDFHVTENTYTVSGRPYLYVAFAHFVFQRVPEKFLVTLPSSRPRYTFTEINIKHELYKT